MERCLFGHVDLVTAPDDSGSLQEWATGISWGDGSGDFSESPIMIIEPTDGIPGSGENTQVTSGAMVATDIDNDGDKDLLISWDSMDWWNQPESPRCPG